MAVSEFEPDDIFNELNRKFANVSIESYNTDSVYGEIHSSDLHKFVETLEFYHSLQHRLGAVRNIRRYLTQDISLDRIQHVFDLGIEDKLREILEAPGFDELKYETAWIITNLAYGTTEQTEFLIDAGVINSLVKCFRKTSNYRVKSQAAWALANVSIESPRYRDTIATEGLIGEVATALVEKCGYIYNELQSDIDENGLKKNESGQVVLHSKTDSDDVKDLTWSLANICRGGFKTSEHWRQYLVAFKAFSKCINFDNEQIWSEACWGLSRVLSNMYNSGPFFENLKLDSRLCPRLISLLKSQASSTILPVIQTISNFSSGPNKYIEILLDAGLLDVIWWYMSPKINHQLRRNAILTSSNLAASHEKIVQKLVCNESIMKSVIAHITVPGHIYLAEKCKWISSTEADNTENKEEWRIVKESLWVLSNISTLAKEDCICTLLWSYPILIKKLASLLHYRSLSLAICSKVVDIFIRIIERTNCAKQPTSTKHMASNTYAEEMFREDVIPALAYLCSQIQNPELTRQTELLQASIMNSSPQRRSDISAMVELAASFGLMQGIPNTRRIVQGCEDGDVRFIEDAINSLNFNQ